MAFQKYGSWSSPIVASLVQNNEMDYTYLCYDQCDNTKSMTVYWIEMRPSENGRNVIISRNVADDNSKNIQWTTESFSARTRVHEYGGGDLFVYGGVVYFSNDYDQFLYMQKQPQSTAVKISHNKNCRYANGFFSGNLESIFIVREDHNNESDIVNTIVMINSKQESIVVQGADFYSSPRVTSDGDRLCWIEWTFPNMPWDNTRICTSLLDKNTWQIIPNSLEIFSASSDCDPISCTLPMWTTTNSLLYINDKNGFWNVWLADSVDNQFNLTPIEEDIGDPMWQFDYRKYNYSSSLNQVVIARKGGQIELLNMDGSRINLIELQSILSYISHPILLPDGSIVALGYSSSSRKTVYRIFNDRKYNILGRNRMMEGISAKYFSIPQLIKYPVPNGFTYGYFYPPCNPDYIGIEGTLPPLLVLAHGGPTAAVFTDLKLSVQYWTSRGFAVFDVDYRGSTGYGKQYRHALKGNWGLYDMEDCCEGAQYLATHRYVDREMMAISGGSAGGYTTLCCLTFSSTFKAGCSLYGIGDLKNLIDNTHKFEMRYLDILIGSYDKNKDLYKNRSPIHFPEKMKCPIIFFQGEDDKIVPKEQSIQMFETVKSRNIPCSIVIYKGEQHGFKKVENIIHQLESEYYFYGQIFKFPTNNIDNSSIIIHNYNFI